MEKCMVYAYKNKINDKSYIGECYEDREFIRKEQHIIFCNRYVKGISGSYCKKFYNAINKYGIDMFEYRLLEKNIYEDKIYERELYWVNYYDSINNGYNLCLVKEIVKLYLVKIIIFLGKDIVKKVN